MDALTAIARHRQVITTVADAIVAAAAGSSLRIRVDEGCSDSTVRTPAFADHLTQALHARGRACRCLTPLHDDHPARAGQPGRHDAAGPATALLVDGLPDGLSGPRDADPCRIHVRVIGSARSAGADPAAAARATARCAGSGRSAGEQPDEGEQLHIVVDYLDPDGPIVRRIDPSRGR